MATVAQAATAPTQALVVVAKVGALSVTAPNLSPEAQAAKAALTVYEQYKGIITDEDVKIFINSQLVEVKQQQKHWKDELAKITDPLLESRRQSMAATRAAENHFAPVLSYLLTGEQILKGEIMRYEDVVERARLEEETERRRKAEEEAAAERQRLEEKARLEAEEAARKDQEERERAEALERQGKAKEAAQVRADAETQLEQSAEAVQQTLEAAEMVEAADVIVPSSSIKLAGTSQTGKWVAEVDDVWEIFAGVVDGSIPKDAVRVRISGRLVPVPAGSLQSLKIEAVEINIPWFQDKARQQGDNFCYRGMKARYDRGLRVLA